jgi:hypothetical protein
MSKFEKIILKYSKVSDSAFFDNNLFPWVPTIEKNIPIYLALINRSNP